VVQVRQNTDAWLGTATLASRIDRWWRSLDPARREYVTNVDSLTIREWLGKSMIRAGIPLTINIATPNDPYVLPAEVVLFLNDRRLEAYRGRPTTRAEAPPKQLVDARRRSRGFVLKPAPAGV